MNNWLIALIVLCIIGALFVLYDAVYNTVEGPEDEDGNDFAALDEADNAFLRWIDELKGKK